FAPDGKSLLATASWGGLAFVDIETGTETRLDRHAGGIQSVAFLPDGRRAISVAEDGKLIFWDLEKRAALSALLVGGRSPRAACSPDGSRFLIGDAEAEAPIALRELPSGRLIRTLGRPVRTHALAFSADGRRALSGGADVVARLWDLDTGKELRA